MLLNLQFQRLLLRVHFLEIINCTGILQQLLLDQLTRVRIFPLLL